MFPSVRRRLLALGVITTSFFLIALQLSYRHPAISDDIRFFVGDSVFYENKAEALPESTGPTNTAKPTANSETSVSPPDAVATPEKQEKVLVAAKIETDDISWIHEKLPDWPTAIYAVDYLNSTLYTSRNKGHEASAYLTYIVDHYHKLPEIVLFIHPHEQHKHGTKRDDAFEGIDYDNVETIQTLNLDFVKRNGFTNLRCMSSPGCPAEIQPFRPEAELDSLRPQEQAMPGAWSDLFRNSKVPHIIAAPCCAQFAVPATQILERPKEDYERFLNWLYTTPLDDFTSGRVFEYLWHIIFGKDPVYCPDPETCYANQYGVKS